MSNWLLELEQRTQRQLNKYRDQRGGLLVPVAFTGSVDDLRVVSNAKARRGSNADRVMLTARDLDTFEDSELDEWCRIFHEYWLTLVRSVRELRDRTNGDGTSVATDPPAAKTFLSAVNYPYLRLSVELILPVFEQDTTANERAVAESVRNRLCFENRYLARRIVERPDLAL